MPRLICCFTVVLFVSILTLWAQPELYKHTVRVGVLEDNYPYSYKDDKGNMDGFAYDLVTELSQVMGLKVERVVGKTAVINAAFKTGYVDLLQSFARSNKRDSLTSFSVPYMTMTGQVFVRKGGSTIQLFSDLKGLKVMVHKGSLGEEILIGAGMEQSIQYVESVEASLRKLENGEGDATLASRLTGLSMVDHLGLKRIKALDIPVEGYKVEYCIAVHKDDEHLLELVNEGLALLVSTGRFDALYQEWFGFIEPIGYTTEQLLLAIALGLMLAFGVAVWSGQRQRTLKNRIAQQADKLSIAKDKAEESDRLKTAFLHNISHEIRTPMNAIIGFSETLNLPDLTAKERALYSGIVVQNSHRLLTIVTDIIKMSTIEAGQLEINPGPVDINRLLNDMYELYQPMALKKGLNLEMPSYSNTTNAVLISDVSMLADIFSKLVSNALKFTEKGSVSFGCRLEQDRVVCFVEDTGIGIDPNQFQEIVKPFRQSATVNNQLNEGAGLGLAITKGLVKRLGGQLSLTSKLGKGSRFDICLPLEVPSF